MDSNKCEECTYFIQHYIKYVSDQYVPTISGHCIYSRIKKRDNRSRACDYFQPREEQPEK